MNTITTKIHQSDDEDKVDKINDVNDIDDDTMMTTTTRPFEWLTSPASLKSIILSHTTTTITSTTATPAMSGCHLEENKDKNNDDNDKEEEHDPNITRTALHMGSGSSTVGEFLVEELDYELVVDLDKDEETLTKMKNRWKRKCNERQQQQPSSDCSMLERLQHVLLDFTTCPIPFPNNFFGLIVDKSTLDCTLCSDKATACLLQQVYRCLAVHGIYVVISFHELELLLPLLQNLPGATWNVTCTTMERQIEAILSNHHTNHNHNHNHNHQNDNTSSGNMTQGDNITTTTTTSKPLNVLVARKLLPTCNDEEILLETICQHVHHVNDQWFQTYQPLLTPKRIQQLEQDFSTASRLHSQPNTNDSSPSWSSGSLVALDLVQAYPILFTDQEREHLTFEHFLEDWEAFCDMHPERQMMAELSSSSLSSSRNMITLDDALEFLKEMQ